jgi:hypothetical protein
LHSCCGRFIIKQEEKQNKINAGQGGLLPTNRPLPQVLATPTADRGHPTPSIPLLYLAGFCFARCNNGGIFNMLFRIERRSCLFVVAQGAVSGFLFCFFF